MTLDEVLGRVTNPEDKAFLEKMIKDQNSYITKLETQLKDASKAPASEPGPAGVDKVTYAYLEKKMREDVIETATKNIKAVISEPMFNAVEKDWQEFLKNNMDIKHTTVEYATDAFNLVLGRCLAIKDHPVNQLGKGTTPNPTPNQPTAGTNAQGVQDVNNIIRQTPPTMSNNDINAQSGIPTPQANQVKNTRDSFAGLKARLAGQGGNPFQ